MFFEETFYQFMFVNGNCGFLWVLFQTAVSTANSKLALFFDWLFYQPDKDNIMNIGNAILFNFNYFMIVLPKRFGRKRFDIL